MIRHGEPPYLECSSKGDKRFSAFHARVGGKSIEELYQAAKVFEDGSTGLYWRDAKGKKAVNQEQLAHYYSSLWDQYIQENPELLQVLKKAAGLSDMFGQQGHVCQATELWRIRNSHMEKSMLTILEHTSSSYAPRTYVNAAKGDVTIAIAVDYSTAGERLTHKAAGEKYLDLRFNALDNLQLARKLYLHMKKYGCKTINVAGNGIYTLAQHGLTQEFMNETVYEILAKVHEHWPISEIRSGGQTGVDLAGGVAGVVLGIPTTLLLPKGFKQRHEDKVDREHTEDEIRTQVMAYVEKLREGL